MSQSKGSMVARAFGGVLLSGVCLKVWITANLPLFGDEAFYWLESRHLAPAYDDVPGLTPWLIYLGTLIGGNVEWAVRLPFVLLSLLTLALIVRTAASLGTSRDGWLAGLLALLLPLFAVNGLLAIPDVPLTFAIVLCVEALRRLALGQRFGAWLLAMGLCLGWLSHYRFAVPFLAVGGWLLLHPLGREQLKKRGLWVGGVLGTAAGLAPLLWHQFAEAGSGFAFQFLDRHPWQFQPIGLADVLLQAAVATPLLFVLGCMALWRGAWNRQRADICIVSGAGISILAAYLLLAPFVDAERSRQHWPMPAVLIAMMLVPQLVRYADARWRWVLRGGVALSAAVLGAAMVCILALAHTPARLADGPLYLHGFTGWREAGEQAALTLATLPADTVVVADHFTLAAEIAFALDGRRVFSLDHVINDKHGRKGVLARMQRDQRALNKIAAGRPILLIAEESATRGRQRPAWFRQLCARFAHAQSIFEVNVDHGRKRLFGFFQAAEGDQASDEAACVPPAFGYLGSPVAGSRWTGSIKLEGWAIRDRVGLVAVRVLLGGRLIGILDDVSSPSVQEVFTGSDDPRHPDVGFVDQLSSDLPAGHYWLEIETEGNDGLRSIVASTRIYWQPAK